MKTCSVQYIYGILCFAILIVLAAGTCKSTESPKQTEMTKLNKTPDKTTEGDKKIITAPVVEKSFINKIGKPTDKKELYLQRSIQDYYIKFCESKVTQKELQEHLNNMEGLIKAVTVEVEFKKGEWDICDDDPLKAQSRTGEYVIIHRIL